MMPKYILYTFEANLCARWQKGHWFFVINLTIILNSQERLVCTINGNVFVSLQYKMIRICKKDSGGDK